MRAETRPDRAATLGALLRVVVAAACWGLAAVFAKHVFERGVPPVRLAEARVAVAVAVLAPLLAWRSPRLLRPPPGTLPLLAGFGACVAAVNLSYYLAIDHLPVGVAVSLQYTGPAMVLAVTALAGSAPRHGRLAWLAAGITLAGAVLVSRALEGLGGLDVPGVAAGLASAVTFAAYLLTAELAGRRGAHPATTLLWGFLTAVAIWSLVAPWWSWPLEALGDPGVALAVAGVGVVGTLVPFALAVGAVRVISAATAGIAATSEPLFAAAFAWVLLGQRLAPPQLAGGALVVAGVVLAQLAAAAAGPDRRPRGAGRPAPG
ncbi:MAG TPA: EamA family transporter [Actinomycetes bacterium]|jgi:drug/metabolite transporter (DMT)-like permease|nr:EamA family transporter [Actinomycetes bacterium]